MKKISPSILNVNPNHFVEYVNQLVKWGVSNVHYDVMDKIFVPNDALQLAEIKEIKNSCLQHIMDIHLMVQDVKKYYSMYKNVGDILTFHYEVLDNKLFNWIIREAKKDNIKIGIAINPETNILEAFNFIKEKIHDISLILIMSVHPGKGGQKFIYDSLQKVSFIKNEFNKMNIRNIIIQIDGGINDLTIKKSFDAGVDLAVVGSYLVKNFSKNTIDNLLSSDLLEK